MFILNNDTKNKLYEIRDKNEIYLEGNILKLIDAAGDKSFEVYLNDAISRDKEQRKKRLEITKQIQSQNKELVELKDKLDQKLIESERAKDNAIQDLDLLQKKTQTELMGSIVKVALSIVIGIGLTTTVLYGLAFFLNKDTTLLGNAWSNMLGILLTNSFSIIGTIMGIKHVTNYSKEKSNQQ